MQCFSRLNKSKSILFAILLVVAPGAVAQESQPVRISQDICRDMAVENNKKIRIARKQAEKSGFDRNAVKALYFPKLSGYGGYLYTNTTLATSIAGGYLPVFKPSADGTLKPDLALNPATGAPIIGADGNPVFNSYAYMPDISLKIDPSGTFMAGLKLEQPIYMGGKIIAANKMAELGKEMTQLNLRYTRNEVILKSDEAYWQYLRVKELVKTAEAYLELVSALEKQVSDAHKVGMVRRSDLLKVQVKKNEAELQVSQARNALELSAMALCHVMGLPLLTQLETEETMLDAEAPVFTDEDYVRERPEYSILGKEAELRKREMQIVRADYLPQVGGVVNYGYANGLDLNGTKLMDNASFSAMVSVNVPIFSWGEGRNKVRSKKMEQEMAVLKQEEVAEQLELEIAAARTNLEDAWLRVEMTTKSMRQADENLRESKDMYEVGFETLADYLEAQTQWQKAVNDRIDALSGYNLGKSKYLKAIGKL